MTAELADTVRLAAFFGVFACMAVWELAAPRRKLSGHKGVRWISNVLIVVVDTVCVRLVLPMAAVGAAELAQANGIGVFNAIPVHPVLAFVVAFAALDFIIYLQHVAFHAVPLLWRLHLVHHADEDIDVTTGLRFHPFEIVISMGIKISAIALLGPPVLAVVVFEIVLNATSMFNHSNIRLPLRVDRILRLIVVTPDMHRVHHSTNMKETNSNYGFNLPWWDRLCRTYRAQPELGHDAMHIGLDSVRGPRTRLLHWMLALPFISPASNGASERRQP